MATISGGGTTNTLSLGSNEPSQIAATVQGAINAALANGSLTRTTSPTVAAAAGQGLAQIVTSGAYALPTTTTGLIVSPGSASATVTGAAATGNTILVDTTVAPFVFNTNGGSGSLVTGDGANLIGTSAAAGTASYFIQTGNGNDTIVAFSGTNTVSAGGGSNLIGTGAAGTTSTNLIFASGDDTITGGAGKGTDIVIAGAGTRFVSPGSKNLTFLGTVGTATIIGGSGSEFVSLGTGGGQAGAGSAGPNILLGGAGAAGSTLFGGANGDILFARGTGNTVIVAAGGNETLQGGASSGNNTYFIGSGNDVIGTGTGQDLIVSSGVGSAVINASTAVGSVDTFRFINRAAGSTANVVINNFSTVEKIQLIGYGSSPTSGVASTATGPSGQVLTLTDGTKITFVGTSASASNFI